MLHPYAFSDTAVWEKLSENNEIEINNEDRKKVSVTISGKNNKIIIGRLSKTCRGSIKISISGDNCTVVIEEGVSVSQNVSVLMGQLHHNFGPIKNATLYIGKHTSFEQCSIILFNSNSSVEIGKKCMFAYGITIFNTDAHPIYDVNSGDIINKVGSVIVRDHCWIGAKSTILKNVELASDTIVGWGSVVSRKYYSSSGFSAPPSNCIIAGNPARIVRLGVTWDSNGSNGYIQNENKYGK